MITLISMLDLIVMSFWNKWVSIIQSMSSQHLHMVMRNLLSNILIEIQKRFTTSYVELIVCKLKMDSILKI